jgi:hypothetical protein
VKGIPAGEYTRSKANKDYALKAVSLLERQPELAIDRKALWSAVMAGEKKTENQQMDVVLSLWRAGLLGHVGKQ